jgi:uncharacterized protein (TIGR02598 family)
MHPEKFKKRRGFSLVEVVVAIGIFALAIVGVIGLLAPTSKNVNEVVDGDAATRVISAIQSALQESASNSSGGFTALGSALQTPAANVSPTYDYYATKDGHVVGKAQAFTDASLTDADKFFEFALLRNTTLSGPDNSGDAAAGYLAFTISIRWPAYVMTASGTAAPVADTQKSVMIVPAAITR